MAASYSFRSALNGFNREDVVRHMEYINTKHVNQVNQLKADLEAADRELAKLRPMAGLQELVESLQLHCAELEQEKLTAQQQIQSLQEQLQAAQAQQAQVITRNEEELEAYRRAERIERQAQLRAQQLCDRANGIIAEASTKVDSSAANLGTMADQVASQLAVLQQAVIGSKAALQEAAAALYTVRPE